MYHIRTTKTGSLSIAVQIVKYVNRKRIVVSHIGSARNSEELNSLKQVAREWIEKTMNQARLFSLEKETTSLIALNKCQYLGVQYQFVYEVLFKLSILFKFHLLKNSLLVDMVIIRLIEPASKLRSLELLEELFGIQHNRRDWYRAVPSLVSKKDEVESRVVALVKKEFSFDFAMVFYDVTTLYFESFKSDEFKKPGFSKDGKSNQPQIVIGLIVSPEGFPVAYEVFEGNKFEGHTLTPVILDFKQKHKIETLTVVADAAMISFENVKSLKENGLKYIVGARMGNLPISKIQSISQDLNQVDGVSLRSETGHGDIICSFSAKRYRKDKYEMEKQLEKAGEHLKDPSKLKRTKFLKTVNSTDYELNSGLVEKTKLLLGIKGYYTNLDENGVSNIDIIRHYHNLWHVEQAFRVAKSDLEMRPIYHFKEHTIKAHILICFMALAMSKYMEIKTGKSIGAITRELKKVTDASILNKLTNETVVMRSLVSEEIEDLLQKLGLPH